MTPVKPDAPAQAILRDLARFDTPTVTQDISAFKADAKALYCWAIEFAERWILGTLGIRQGHASPRMTRQWVGLNYFDDIGRPRALPLTQMSSSEPPETGTGKSEDDTGGFGVGWWAKCCIS